MALIPLRTLLDHAAENDYGVAAFNVNNMEQIQAIMEAAEDTDSPVIVQASRGAREVFPRYLPKTFDDGGGGTLSSHPHCDASGSRQQRRDLQERNRQSFHLGDDGRFARRGR